VTIVTGFSVLCTVWGSVRRIHSHSGTTYTLFLHMYAWHHRANGRNGIFGLFFLPILPQFKNFFQKSKCEHHPRTRCHLYAKSDILRPSQSWDIVGEKQSPTQTYTQLIFPSVNVIIHNSVLGRVKSKWIMQQHTVTSSSQLKMSKVCARNICVSL